MTPPYLDARKRATTRHYIEPLHYQRQDNDINNDTMRRYRRRVDAPTFNIDSCSNKRASRRCLFSPSRIGERF